MKNTFTKTNILIGLMSLSSIPFLVFAAPTTLKDLARLAADYLNIGLSLIIGLAVITFVWNVYLYYFTEKDKAEAGMYVLYSIIGFFLILSFWGLVYVVKNSIPLDNQAPPSFPNGFNFNSNGGGSNNTNTGNSSLPKTQSTGSTDAPRNGYIPINSSAPNGQ